MGFSTLDKGDLEALLGLFIVYWGYQKRFQGWVRVEDFGFEVQEDACVFRTGAMSTK